MRIQPTPTAMAKPGEVYTARLKGLHAEQFRLERRYRRLSRWRRLLIGVLVVLVMLVGHEGLLTKLVLIGVPALLIEHLIKRRGRVAMSMWIAQWLEEHYERRLACVEDRWVGTGDPGVRYSDPDHPAAADFDLFGAGSLFERLSIPCTRVGADTLASWLLVGAGSVEILNRQLAVAELRDRFELREELACLAGQIEGSAELPHLARWGQASPVLASRTVRLLGALVLLFTFVTLIGGAFFGIGGVPLLVALTVQCMFAAALRRPASEVLSPIEDKAFDLLPLGRMFARLGREQFTSSRMVRLSAEFAQCQASLARLHVLHRWATFALILMCRPQMAMLLDRWRQSTGPTFERWLAALGEIEALCALATYSFEYPADPFPEVFADGAVFESEALGHPLLPRVQCVRNDVVLGTNVRVLIVSGSNMAGKSTLLRAVGINAVLAFAGGPVRASRLRLAPLAVGGTLRIQDSLQLGRSRFQAEILRVRKLLDMARGAPPLLFLLDELFQGTNSADRRFGAEAVIRQLLEAGAIGLITTHDLALTEIADQLNGRAVNVHFEDCLEDGELVFDYLMKPGPAVHTNGIAVMRAVGIIE